MAEAERQMEGKLQNEVQLPDTLQGACPFIYQLLHIPLHTQANHTYMHRTKAHLRSGVGMRPGRMESGNVTW